MDVTPTMTASRLRGVSGGRCSGGGFANASLGKNTRKSTILRLALVHQYAQDRLESHSHGHETNPLHTNLDNTQQSSTASLAGDFTTTSHIVLTTWQDQNIRECSSRRYRAQ
jgi:hypothetical protein